VRTKSKKEPLTFVEEDAVDVALVLDALGQVPQGHLTLVQVVVHFLFNTDY